MMLGLTSTINCPFRRWALPTACANRGAKAGSRVMAPLPQLVPAGDTAVKLFLGTWNWKLRLTTLNPTKGAAVPLAAKLAPRGSAGLELSAPRNERAEDRDAPLERRST